MPTLQVDLASMLEARERRLQIQKELLFSYHKPILCLTMNIAGPVKRTPLVRLLFDHGLFLFEQYGFSVVEKRTIDLPTGCEAFFSVDSDPLPLKQAVCNIEESFSAARLFDFDVIDNDGNKLSRKKSRTCIVCGGPVQACARSRAHGLDLITEKTNALLKEFAADYYSKAAYDALIHEVHTTPKPGLVDENNCGAHRDMDLGLFEKSASALLPFFHDAVIIGIDGSDMSSLRKAGLQAEEHMLSATNGVNTHKGAIFSFGLILYAIGNALINGSDVYNTVSHLLHSEKRNSASSLDTNGELVRKRYGIMGAVEEAKAGFPSARYAANRLSEYRLHLAPNPEALTLCDLLSRVEDTNLYHRGGAQGAAFVRTEAQRISRLSVYDRIKALYQLDEEMIQRNLSPGGCADMLALALLIEQWNKDSLSLFR